MRRFAFGILCAFLAIIMLFCGCTSGVEPTDAVSIVSQLCETEPTLPNGVFYAYAIDDPTAELLSEEMLSSMFGDGRMPSELDEASSGACYLSYSHPYEITLFCAKSRNGAQLLAKMLLRRKEIITRYWADQAYDEYLQNAEVTVCGNWVLLSVSRDPQTTVKVFKHAV